MFGITTISLRLPLENFSFEIIFVSHISWINSKEKSHIHLIDHSLMIDLTYYSTSIKIRKMTLEQNNKIQILFRFYHFLPAFALFFLLSFPYFIYLFTCWRTIGLFSAFFFFFIMPSDDYGYETLMQNHPAKLFLHSRPMETIEITNDNCFRYRDDLLHIVTRTGSKPLFDKLGKPMEEWFCPRLIEI